MHTGWWLALSACTALACTGLGCNPASDGNPVRSAESAPVLDHPAPVADDGRPPPSCQEAGTSWPRAAAGPAGIARAEGGRLRQDLTEGSTLLSFMGTHAFDLLDKLAHEGKDDAERRQIVCALLNDAAERGARVIRLWGSLKETGSADEVARAADMLELVLDENARRQRPLRFIVTLLNHQAGYGAPDPSRSLDEQPEGSPWRAQAIYFEGGWQKGGHGLLADRIAAFAARPEAGSPYILAWELVNELDVFKSLGGGFSSEAGIHLAATFIRPALERLGAAVPQPLMIGDVRGPRGDYEAWAAALIDDLPSWIRARLVWTTHVYAERGADPEEFLHKLDIDLRLAKKHDLPFVLGELGQYVPGIETSLCKAYAHHDIGSLLSALDARGVRALLVWGEGLCSLAVGGRTLILGAGSDSAEIGPADRATVELLHDRRMRGR